MSDQEREGWQLLLWSYRHELGLDHTHTSRATDLDDQGEFHASRDRVTWQPDEKMATGDLADDRAEWTSWSYNRDKAYGDPDDGRPDPPA